MLDRTFETLKKNPKIILLVAAMYLVPIVVITAMTYLLLPESLSPSLASMTEIYRSNNYYTNYFIVTGVSMAIYLLIVFLGMPPVGNYIYEVCAGKDTDGWYKRGLKKGWWKVFVLGLMYIVVAAIVSAVMIGLAELVGSAFFIMMVLFLIVIVAMAIFVMIAYTVIMAEDDFGVALGNVFIVGSRYCFKLLGTIILVGIPSYILSVISANIQMDTLMNGGGTTGAYWIVTLLAALYGTVASAYIYTYSMNYYLYERSPLAPSFPSDDVGEVEE